MRTEYYRAEDLAKVFRTQKIATMAELKDVLGSSADITIFRKLTELSSRTSYSHRGRFYTLADIPDYDAWGLWSYRSVWFSQRGTLLATAEALVQEADAGFFVAELEGVLNVEVKGALLRLVRQQKLARASVAGRYLYCAPDAATRNAQRSARRVLDAATPHGGRVPHIDVLPDELRASIILFCSLLDEQQRRLYAGLESLKMGHGGDQAIADLLGLDVGTVARGRHHLLDRDVDVERVRRAGAGRRPVEKKTPEVIARIEELMTHETAGDPMSGLKWTRRTTEKIAAELRSLGIGVGPRTVARLLTQLGFSLRVNQKKRSTGSPSRRNEQFEQIASLRERFVTDAAPIISVDTKKKELVGHFKNAGVAWNRAPVVVNDHDFRSEAEGIAIPYGIYDLQANRGTMFVGTTYDTPSFAVDAIEQWWRTEGATRYPGSRALAILADGGGSNGARCRAWKFGLQRSLCDRHGLSITVAHYPPGASQWNPIEHRLFSEVSKNWAGKPLDSYDTILNYLRTTRTSTGLRVRAHLVRRRYVKGIKIAAADMNTLALEKLEPLPAWNYTLQPRC